MTLNTIVSAVTVLGGLVMRPTSGLGQGPREGVGWTKGRDSSRPGEREGGGGGPDQRG